MRTAALLLCLVLSPAVAQDAPERPGRYNAVDTIRRAHIGTFSAPAERPPVRRPLSDLDPPPFERFECRADYTRRLPATVVCETRRTQK